MTNMVDLNGHSEVSPSVLHRVIPCPGSVAACRGVPRTESAAAAEGTAMHTIAAMCLYEKHDATSFIGVDFDVFVLDDERAGTIQVYLDHVRRVHEKHGGELLVEQTLPIPQIDGRGTADAAIVGCGDGVLRVIDFKGGRGVKVDAVDNPQLLAYALPLVREWELVHDIYEVELHIVQPRIDHIDVWRVPVIRLDEFAATLVQTMAVAYSDGAPLRPGEKQCKFCPAKGSCPALRDYVAETVARDFDNLVDENLTAPTLAPSDWLARVLPRVGMVRDWCNAVEDEAERRLHEGIDVPGFKLVEGRRGHRKWSDEAAVEETLRSFRMKQDEMYDMKLISPTAAEKRLKDSPRRWAKVEALITRDDGKPVLAPVSDKRPAIQASAADFSIIDDEV